MPLKGVIHVDISRACLSGPDFDVLEVLSAGGVKIAFLTLSNSLQSVEVDDASKTEFLAAPPALALRATAAVALRSLLDDLYLETSEVLCITAAPADATVRAACCTAGLPLVEVPPPNEPWPPQPLTVPGHQQRAETLISGPERAGHVCMPSHAPAWLGLAGSAVSFQPLDELAGSNLEFLARLVAQSQRGKAGGHTPESRAGAPLVAVLMKPSRFAGLVRAGLLALVPVGTGACYQLVSPEHPLHQQGTFDALLAKVSDFMEGAEPGCLPRISPFALALLAEAEKQLCIPVIDPLPLVQKVMDRQAMAECLAAVSADAAGDGVSILPPPSLLVESWASGGDLEGRLSRAGVGWPLLAKPQLACGLPCAHNMALVFNLKGLRAEGLPPPPLLLQRFVDHAGLVHKAYVISDKVHVTQKPSLPDVGAWVAGVARPPDLPLPTVAVPFDTSRDAPGSLEGLPPLILPASRGRDLDRQVLDKAVQLLRKHLGLSLFGFDIIVDSITGTHFIVDVNYLPSYANVPGASAALSLVVQHAIAIANS